MTKNKTQREIILFRPKWERLSAFVLFRCAPYLRGRGSCDPRGSDVAGRDQGWARKFTSPKQTKVKV